MKFEIFRQILEKKLKYHISSKSGQWEPSCYIQTNRRTDRSDEAFSSFLQFCERA